MTIEDVKAKMLDLTQAIREYKDGKDYDSDELEILVDDMLCRLPRDVFYIEWFDRSQIRDMVIDRIEYANQETEITDTLIDECMHNLRTSDDGYIRNDDIYWTIIDTIKEHKGNKDE